MVTSQNTFAEICSVMRRKGAFACCLFLFTLGLGVSAIAQEAAPALKSKEVVLHKLLNPPHGADPAGAIRVSAIAQEAAPALNSKEVVLHNFASPLHGAYPANGVIRDEQGNLYGTTNGAYSDVPGGGTNNAGVVFKLDPWGNETVLYSFTGGADGSSPNDLTRDWAGNLYGTTTYGGSGFGVVFKVDRSGNETVLYSFTGGADGGNPGSVILDWKGNLYGSTGSGGAGYGVVFKLDPSGKETVLYTFTGGSDGAYPNLNVALDLLGNFYGTTNNGGLAGAGVVFKVDPSGHETVLYTFTGGADGANPNGVTRDWQGNLYGTASGGGGTAGAGVVFKVDPSGHETVLYTFTGGNDGGYSDAGVALDRFGNVYGTTNGGGTAGLGVVFKVNPGGQETVLHTFTRGTDGNQPYLAGVILDARGNLYGTTAFNGAGGQGAVYKLDPSGNATVVYAFPGDTDGQYPYNNGVILGSDGQLYGTTALGGQSGGGVVYQLNGGGRHETVLYSFATFTSNGFDRPSGGVIRDPAGNLYGTTFIGQADVGYGFGVVYKVDTAGHARVLHNFTNGADGGNPYGGVTLDSKGNLYGTASGGGASGAGVVFKIDKSGNEIVLYSFTGGADGGYPFGSVIIDSKGNLYSTTQGGGASGAGVVFKIDKSGNETVLYSFTGGADGGYPLGGVIRDSAGNLYGTTNGGGASGAGVVYKIDASGNETALYSFTGGADGGYPLWVVLARDLAGNLYGTTAGGGTASAGVVFKVDTSGNETVLYSFTGGADGGTPYAGVVLGPNGNLYGTTIGGGQTNAGVVFGIQQ